MPTPSYLLTVCYADLLRELLRDPYDMEDAERLFRIAFALFTSDPTHQIWLCVEDDGDPKRGLGIVTRGTFSAVTPSATQLQLQQDRWHQCVRGALVQLFQEIRHEDDKFVLLMSRFVAPKYS